jgi:hypothetical protein
LWYDDIFSVPVGTAAVGINHHKWPGEWSNAFQPSILAFVVVVA